MPAFAFLSFLFFPFNFHCLWSAVWQVSLPNSLQTVQVSFACPSEEDQQLDGETAAPGEQRQSQQRSGWNSAGLITLLAAQHAKAGRASTAFLLFLGDCRLPEYFLALTFIQDGLWLCLMLSGSWWECHKQFEEFSDNEPGITLFFLFIPLLMSYFSCILSGMSIRDVFEGEEYGLHKVTWMSYMWLV